MFSRMRVSLQGHPVQSMGLGHWKLMRFANVRYHHGTF